MTLISLQDFTNLSSPGSLIINTVSQSSNLHHYLYEVIILNLLLLFNQWLHQSSSLILVGSLLMTIHTWKILKSNTVTMKFPYSSYLFISLLSKSSLPLCTLSPWSSNSFVPFSIDPLYCRKTSLSKPNILAWSHHKSMRKYSLTCSFYRKKPSMIRFLTNRLHQTISPSSLQRMLIKVLKGSLSSLAFDNKNY